MAQRRTAHPQHSWSTGGFQDRFAVAQKIVNGLLGANTTQAFRAVTEMSFDDVAVGLVRIAIDIRRDERIDLLAVGHGCHDFPLSATWPGALSRSNNIRRPREMRDITVPTGTCNISAISAYENSSTSRNQTA